MGWIREFSVKTLMVFEKGFSSTSFEKYLKALFAGGFCRKMPWCIFFTIL